LEPVVEMMANSEIPGPGERESGAYDFLVEIHEKANIRYLGRTNSVAEHIFYVVFTNKPVETPYDLAGQRMAGGAFWEGMWKAIGFISIPIPDPEIYTAVERGVIDGYANPPYVACVFGMHEVVDYYINHPFALDDTAIIMNLDKWNSIPAHLQKLILDTIREKEVELTPLFWAMYQEQGYNVLRDSGLTAIEFSPTDAKWYLDTLITAGVKGYVELDPVDGPKLAEFLGLGDYLYK